MMTLEDAVVSWEVLIYPLPSSLLCSSSLVDDPSGFPNSGGLLLSR